MPPQWRASDIAGTLLLVIAYARADTPAPTAGITSSAGLLTPTYARTCERSGAGGSAQRTRFHASARLHGMHTCQGARTHSTARHAQQRSAAQRSAAQCSAAQRSAAQRSTVQCSAAQRIAAQRIAAQHSAAQCSAVQRSAAQRSKAKQSKAKRSAVQCCAVPYRAKVVSRVYARVANRPCLCDSSDCYVIAM